MKFKVTYSSGLVEEVETSDANDLHSFCNVKFGLTEDEIIDQGTKVEIVDETPVEPPPVEPPPVEPPPVEPPPVEPAQETPAA